jgi:site-specific DNA-methyltransferase (adenine-specific)
MSHDSLDGGNAVVLRHGDAAQEIAGVLAELVLTDPPYAFDKMGFEWSASDDRRKTQGQTVSNLSAGMAFKPEQAQRAKAGFAPFASAISGSLIEGGFALVFSAPRLAHGFCNALEDAGLAIRDILVWQHNSGQFKASSLERFGVAKEHRVPQPRPTFETIIVAQKLPRSTLSECWKANETGMMRERTIGGDIPSSTIVAAKPSRNEREAGGRHPTQKPEALLRELIHLFSMPGQTVLDPFMGSGSTGAAAISLGRRFVGVERDAAFFEVAKARLSNSPSESRST